ncbi:hypothetical protein JCM15908A_04380 [Prevotella dentasini JCM 15908]
MQEKKIDNSKYKRYIRIEIHSKTNPNNHRKPMKQNKKIVAALSRCDHIISEYL